MQNQTSEETQEETLEEPVEETLEDSVEETSDETVETETPEETPSVDYESKFKASQSEALKLKKQLDEMKKSKKSSTTSNSEPLDVDSILEVQTATKGLDADEVEELRLRAKATGESLTEARKNDNFVLWREAKKAKVAKEKALKPSSTQTESSKPKTLEDRLAEAKTFEEKEKILSEVGMNPMQLGTDINHVEDFM